MIWYDKGVSVVWIDTYPSKFFTLHIHFFGLTWTTLVITMNHICNIISAMASGVKKNTITVVYYWHNINITSGTQQHLLTVALFSLSNKIFIICVPHFFSQILTPPPPPPPRLMSCHCVKPTKSRCYKLFNTSVPGRCSKYFKSVNFSFRLQIEFLSNCEIALMCMSRK